MLNKEVVRGLFLLFYRGGSQPSEYVLSPVATEAGEEGAHLDALVAAGMVRYSNRIHSNRKPEFATLELTDNGKEWAARSLNEEIWDDGWPHLSGLLEPARS